MPRSNELQPTAYGETIKQVKKVNRQAALIMARKLPLLKQRGLMEEFEGPGLHQKTVGLLNAFRFKATPQGVSYWWDICNELMEM